jgi:hypothetical protein
MLNVKFLANSNLQYILGRNGCQRFSPGNGAEAGGVGNLWFSEINGKILSSMKRLENQTIFDFFVKDFLTKGVL